MRRSVLPWFVVLAVLTALALMATAAALRMPDAPPVSATAADAANRALTYRFYEAANVVIASGEPADLTALVAEDFVDTTAEPDSEPDRETLVDRLLILHITAPDLRLAAEAVAAAGEIAVAQIRVDGAVAPLLGGHRLDVGWIPWGPVDVFRIVDGRIVERRGPPLDPVSFFSDLQLQATLDLPSPDLQTLTVARITLEPGARYAAPILDGPRLMLAESGAVNLETTSGPLSQVPKVSPHPLAGGEHVTLAARTGVVVTNQGTTPAVLLDIAIAAVPFTDAATERRRPAQQMGVIVEYLADHLLITVPARPAILTIDRVHLSSVGQVTWTPGLGPMLLHVEAGEFDLSATGDIPWIAAGAGERSAMAMEASLLPGDGVLLSAGAAAVVRGAAQDPATLLIVALLPSDTASGDDAPCDSRPCSEPATS